MIRQCVHGHAARFLECAAVVGSSFAMPPADAASAPDAADAPNAAVAADAPDAPNAPDARDAADARDGTGVEVLEAEIDSLRRDGRFADAVVLAQRLLAIREAESGQQAPRVPWELIDARVMLSSLVEIAALADSSRHEMVEADRLTHAFHEFLDAGELDEAERSARASLALVEEALGPDHPETTYRVNDLAVVLGEIGELDEAEALHLRALSAWRISVTDDHPNVATSLNNLGLLFVHRGDFAEGERWLRQGLARREQILDPGDPDISNSLNNLGTTLYELGRYDEAERMLRDALERRLREVDPPGMSAASTYNNLALLLQALGASSEAEECYTQAIDIVRATLGDDHPYVGFSLANLAKLLHQQGDFRRAENFDRAAVEKLRGSLGPHHPEVALVLNYLAMDLSAQERYDEAESLYAGALAVQRTLPGREFDVAVTLSNRAANEARRERYPEAERLYLEAREIWQRTLEETNPRMARNLSSLAVMARLRGDLAEALRREEEAFRTLRAVSGPENPDVAKSLQHLAEVRLGLGQRERAFEDALEAERIGREHLRITARVSSERRALHHALVRASGLDVALTITVDGGDPNRVHRAWDAVIRSRALVVDELASRHRALARVAGGEVDSLWEAYASARERLANLAVRGPQREGLDSYRRAYSSAREEAESAESGLVRRSAAFREEIAREEVGIEEALEGIPDGAALVAYVRYLRREPNAPDAAPAYAAFVATSSGSSPEIVPLADGATIDEQVSAWRRRVSRPPASDRAASDEEASREAGAALRRTIWDPVAARIVGSSLVFVVPDGILNLVSFSALPDAGIGYFLETGPTFHYLSAERDLAPIDSEPARGSGLLVMGDPAFDQAGRPSGETHATGIAPAWSPQRNEDRPRLAQAPAHAAARTASGSFRSGCADLAAVQFQELPGSREEVKAVIAAWRRGPGREGEEPTSLLTGADATETAFKRDAPGRRALHLATHGFFLGERCGSGVDRARGVGSVSWERDEPLDREIDDPLLLSGLALAGANVRSGERGGDDGILTAAEIAAMDLDGVEWVVLSACETGRGEIRSGEGVLGLRRAFRIAGARTLILSLWPIEDQTARAFMAFLSKNRFHEGRPGAEAVKAAARTVLDARRARDQSTHPFYWGGFVAAGDWR